MEVHIHKAYIQKVPCTFRSIYENISFISTMAMGETVYRVRPWVAIIFLPDLACISGGNLRPNWVLYTFWDFEPSTQVNA